MEVDYIVAPFEADAQLAFLEKGKVIDGVITEDSDLLAFGCSRVNNCVVVRIGGFWLLLFRIIKVNSLLTLAWSNTVNSLVSDHPWGRSKWSLKGIISKKSPIPD